MARDGSEEHMRALLVDFANHTEINKLLILLVACEQFQALNREDFLDCHGRLRLHPYHHLLLAFGEMGDRPEHHPCLRNAILPNIRNLMDFVRISISCILENRLDGAFTREQTLKYITCAQLGLSKAGRPSNIISNDEGLYCPRCRK